MTESNNHCPCPTEGEIRMALDGDDDAARAVRDHLATCDRCAEFAAGMRVDAEASDQLLASLEPGSESVDYRRALDRLESKLQSSSASTEGSFMQRFMRQRGARAAGAVAGLLAVIMVLAISPVGGVAGDVLDRFRVQKFAAITVDMESFQEFQTNMLFRAATSDHEALQTAFEDIGTFETTFDKENPMANAQEFASAEEAEAVFGEFDQPSSIPDGYAAEPEFYVSDAGSASATINTAKLQQLVDELSLPIYSLPDPATAPELNFTVDIPQALLIQYAGETEDQELVYAQMTSPTLVTPESLDMDQLREEMLALPGLPPDFVAQLRSIQDWEETLVVPVPAGWSSEDVTIDGEPGLLVSADDDTGAVVLWEKSGSLHLVGATADGDVVMDVANSVQ